jgi:hypothetical protein
VAALRRNGYKEAILKMQGFFELRRSREKRCRRFALKERPLEVSGARCGDSEDTGGDFVKESPPFSFYQGRSMTVECAGIGGQMVKAGQKQAEQGQAVKGKPRGTRTRKKAGSRGAARMSEAAGKALEKNSEQIANSLLQSTLDGNASSAKLLFALAEGQKNSEEKGMKRHFRSMAVKLAAEPQWNAGAIEATIGA